MKAIEIRNLSKSFRGMYAVDHLNMTVPVGAIAGLSFDTAVFVAIGVLLSVVAKQRL